MASRPILTQEMASQRPKPVLIFLLFLCGTINQVCVESNSFSDATSGSTAAPINAHGGRIPPSERSKGQKPKPQPHNNNNNNKNNQQNSNNPVASLVAYGRRIRSIDALDALDWYDIAWDALTGSNDQQLPSTLPSSSSTVQLTPSGDELIVNPPPPPQETTTTSSSSSSSMVGESAQVLAMKQAARAAVQSLVPQILSDPENHAVFLEDYADLLSHMKRFARAAVVRSRAVGVRSTAKLPASITDMVTGLAALAEDHRLAGNYALALRILGQAKKVAKLDPLSKSIIVRFESSVLECAGKSEEALVKLDTVRELRQKGGKGEASYDLSMDLQELDLLRAILSDRDVGREKLSLMTENEEEGGEKGLDGRNEVEKSQQLGKRSTAAKTPIRTREEFEERRKVILKRIMATGKFENELQLPQEYIPGLKSSPFFPTPSTTTPADNTNKSDNNNNESSSSTVSQQVWWPQLSPVVDALKAATPDLIQEYLKLSSQNLMYNETECIHENHEGSFWTWYATNGYWVRKSKNNNNNDNALDAAIPASAEDSSSTSGGSNSNSNSNKKKVYDEECANDTPVACALLRRIFAMGVPHLKVLRSGYSAIGPHTHLRPHCGTTNGQLKFHLGLIIPCQEQGSEEGSSNTNSSTLDPSSSSTYCARIRVGATQTKHWEQGQVLFFDDSFEHEVWNMCDVERVVFQFVFVHPDLAAKEDSEGGASGKKGAPHRNAVSTH